MCATPYSCALAGILFRTGIFNGRCARDWQDQAARSRRVAFHCRESGKLGRFFSFDP